MNRKIVFVALLVLGLCCASNSQAVETDAETVAPSAGPPDFCQIHLNILQSEANKINTPDLDEDLKLRIADVLENAKAGCSDCEGLVIWQNKVCLVANLRAGLGQLAEIKTEAEARNAIVLV